MTDLDRMKSLFDSLGIPYEVNELQFLIIPHGIGYEGFTAEFSFDTAGNFMQYGIWE